MYKPHVKRTHVISGKTQKNLLGVKNLFLLFTCMVFTCFMNHSHVSRCDHVMWLSRVQCIHSTCRYKQSQRKLTRWFMLMIQGRTWSSTLFLNPHCIGFRNVSRRKFAMSQCDGSKCKDGNKWVNGFLSHKYFVIVLRDWTSFLLISYWHDFIRKRRAADLQDTAGYKCIYIFEDNIKWIFRYDIVSVSK